jgi:hypothetical protein
MNFYNPDTNISIINHIPSATTAANNITYIVNEIVEPDAYNHDSSVVCTSGIHYFKTLVGVLSYLSVMYECTELSSYKFNGFVEQYSDNGDIREMGYFLNGQKTNRWTHFNINAQPCSHTQYNAICRYEQYDDSICINKQCDNTSGISYKTLAQCICVAGGLVTLLYVLKTKS